jgi:iron(III) transport system substrate-binding protein
MKLFKLVLALGASLSLSPAQASDPDWMMPDILAAAKAEGSVTIYSSVNEGEALPQWRIFEQATGIKVNYVRASDAQLNGRIAVEHRAQQASWDLIVSSAVSQLNQDVLIQYDVPQTATLIEAAKDKNRRWYAVSAYYNTPAYNTKLVNKADLPKSYEELAKAKQWRGKIAIDTNDGKWLAGMFRHFGEDRARKMMLELVENLRPTIVDGHLALARNVGAGEYALALSNYTALTHNVQLNGAPTDTFVLDPVVVFMHQLGISARAPHPKAALLAANFAFSQQSQAFGARSGRTPVRPDVEPNPPDAISRMQGRTIVPVVFTPEDERKWKRTFDEIFKPR